MPCRGPTHLLPVLGCVQCLPQRLVLSQQRLVRLNGSDCRLLHVQRLHCGLALCGGELLFHSTLGCCVLCCGGDCCCFQGLNTLPPGASSCVLITEEQGHLFK